jgi:Secretion system C-terminal sorting domain
MKLKKNIAFLVLSILLLTQYSIAQTTIYLSSGSNLFISSGTVFSTDSLSLLPSINFNLTGQNSETKNVTLTHLSANPYIKRVFNFLNTTIPFTVDVTIYYQDAELNGIAENVLTLNVHNGTAWNAYSTGVTRDGVNNFVTTPGLSNIELNELTLASLSSPLPVNFTLFNALCITGGVTLTWKTAQEFNSKNFEVQRSADGRSWQAIASVNAAGNSSTERSYTYTDNRAAANSLYRIAEYDINGRSSISFTLRSSCASSDLLAVYPNPVHNAALINIKVNAAAAATVSLRLYDTKGTLVKTMEANLFPGNNQLLLDIKGLANGSYLLTTKWGNNIKQTAIIKQ